MHLSTISRTSRSNRKTRHNFNSQILKIKLNSIFKHFFSWYTRSRGESIVVFNLRIMAIIHSLGRFHHSPTARVEIFILVNNSHHYMLAEESTSKKFIFDSQQNIKLICEPNFRFTIVSNI
jgi:hypothetical protein